MSIKGGSESSVARHLPLEPCSFYSDRDMHDNHKSPNSCSTLSAYHVPGTT